MTTQDRNDILEGIVKTLVFFGVCFLIYLLGSTEKWYALILGVPVLTAGFTWFAGKNMAWTKRSAVIGLIAGAAWYIFGI